MKIAIAQINTKVGDIKGNAAKIMAAGKKASGHGADLCVFPECALTGYPAWDLWDDRGFVQANLAALDTLAAAAGDTALAVGFVDRNTSGTGKAHFNSAAILHRGKIAAKRSKTLLPTYDVFDEERYFSSAESNPSFIFKGERIGLTICEDVWNVSSGKGRLYGKDPVSGLIKEKPELMINLSASPYYRGKPAMRHELIKERAKAAGVPFVYVNQCCANDEIVFDGNSMVFDGKGGLVARGRQFAEDFFIVDTERLPKPLEWKPTPWPQEVTQALELGIKDYLSKCGFKAVAVGLSGGIDSAVVACLAANAIGGENVIGISMPSPYTSKMSRDDARALAKNLGVKFYEIPITGIFEAYNRELAPVFEGRKPDITEENLQARVRGALLMAVSNKFGAMLLSTGNKSELAVGYSTLYGDMCGGLDVLGDAVKETVYAVANFINETRGNPIPRRTITRPPSAELRPGQTDQDDLPPYETLDPILAAYVEDGKSESEITALGYPAEIVRNLLNRIDRAEFKRRQAAPGIKLTPKAFGIGRRMPIARGSHR